MLIPSTNVIPVFKFSVFSSLWERNFKLYFTYKETSADSEYININFLNCWYEKSNLCAPVLFQISARVISLLKSAVIYSHSSFSFPPHEGAELTGGSWNAITFNIHVAALTTTSCVTASIIRTYTKPTSFELPADQSKRVTQREWNYHHLLFFSSQFAVKFEKKTNKQTNI